MAGLERLPDDDVRGAVMDWLVGKIQFSPIYRAPDGSMYQWGQVFDRDKKRNIGTELLQSVVEAKQMLFPEGFPCGWDERDAKV